MVFVGSIITVLVSYHYRDHVIQTGLVFRLC